jgi:hypothetical protein
MARSKTASKSAAKKAAKTRKSRTAAKKAAKTRKRQVAGKKAAATRKRPVAGKKAAATRKRPVAAKRAAVTRKTKATVASVRPATFETLPAAAEIDNQIAIVRDNLRQLVEQAASSSGAADEELMSQRIAEQEAKLALLRKQRGEVTG